MSNDEKQPSPSISNVHIIESSDSSWPSNLKNKLPFNLALPHLIIFLFIGVILVEVFFGLKNLATPTEGISMHQPLSGGSVILSSDKESYQSGEKILVSVKIATGGHSTDGTDLVLNYDPNFLELDKASFFKKGAIYPDYSFIDVQDNVISISAISSTSGGTFNGVGLLGTLEFTAKKPGGSKLTLDSKKDSTSDTNITETETAFDILTQVKNLDINIGTSSSDSKAPNEANACQNYTQLCTTDQGKQGTQECSRGSIKSNQCRFDPDLTESCTKCEGY
jgi:hypothetical protein